MTTQEKKKQRGKQGMERGIGKSGKGANYVTFR